MPLQTIEISTEDSSEAIYAFINALLHARMPIADVVAGLGSALVCVIASVAPSERQDEALEMLFADMRKHLATAQAATHKRRH